MSGLLEKELMKNVHALTLVSSEFTLWSLRS